MSLTARILVLIGLTFAAITGAGVHEQISARWKSEAALQDETLRLAYTIGADQDRITEGARQLLLALSLLSGVAERDSARCSRYFIEIKQQLGMYEYLGAADSDGIVFCSSNFAGRPEVNIPHEAGATQETSPSLYINAYGIAFSTHQPILRIAYPIIDERGGIGGHMFAGLSLRWLNERLAERGLPDRAASIVADRNGIVIASHANADLIGQPLAPSLMAQLHAATPGTTEVVDADGVRRLYGFIPVESRPGEGVFVAVGLDAEAAAAEFSRSLWRNITLLAAIVLTAGMAAWIYVRRFIRAPLDALLETAHRWREGDRTARAMRNPQVAEVDRLATAFNAAADAIEAHERQLSEAKRAAELLGDSFRLLFESNPMPLWVFDRETLRFLRVNDATLGQYGYTREQFLSMTIKDVMAPEERHLLDQNLAADSRDLVKVGIRTHLRADGSRIFVNITRHEAMLDGRKTVLVAGLDVTDAVRAEAQLRETADHLRRSREHLAIAQRVSGTGSIERNLRSNEVEWSDEARRILGAGTDLRMSRRETFLAMIHPEDRDRFSKFTALSDRGITPPSFDFRIVRPDGQVRIIHRDTTVLADENGTPLRMIGSIKDVTEQRAAEARLQETTNNLRRSREHLAIAQRVSGIGSIERDLRTGEVEWSDQARRIFLGETDPVGSTAQTFLELVHPDDREKFVELQAQMSRGITPPAFEFRIIRPDGQERIIHRDTTILFDEDDTPARVVGSLRDITELRAAEERQRQLERQLQHSQKLESLGTLAGGIAHDLNNTLVPILALTKITLRQMAEGSRGHANLDTILRASERARDLVQQILAFSRKQELVKQEVDLLALTRETLHMLRAGLPATIDIVERLDAVPPILGDPGQLQQVLVNLMTNAAQAISDEVGTITVALTAVADARLDRCGRTTESAVCLRITDTGCGMDKATLDRIFEPFFTTKAVGEGTGLGLAVAHGIITSHGGRITVRSQPGEGTAFTILLPFYASAVGEDWVSMAG